MLNNEKIRAALAIVMGVADTIRELGSVPSGELYNACMMKGMSYEQYTNIILSLKGARLIEEKSHLLTWIGPKVEGK
jgi:hypothetical protein